MTELNREWKRAERTELFWLGVMPAIGALILVIVLIPAMPDLWLPGFLVAAVGSYTTSFIGVLPLLLWFRRCGWQRPIHYALAGFVGVLVPWWFVGALAGVFPAANFDATLGPMSLLAAAIGAMLSLLFGVISNRAKTML